MTEATTRTNSPGQGQTLDLGEDLTIVEVAMLQQQMLKLVQSSDEVILDGSNISRIDAAGVQLLAAFAKEVTVRHIFFAWSGVSECLADAAALLGFSELLNLESGVSDESAQPSA